MGKHEVGTPKYIANKIKAKGLQKLRWYCQMCQKQCRDENGFKCHTSSESHQRQLLIFADNADKYIDEFSKEFSDGYLELLHRQFGTKRVHANKVYQDYIADRDHLHMNATQWESLTEFVKWLGREGKCVVDETEKGWFVSYIERDPETIELQNQLAKKTKMEKDDEEKMQEFFERQVKLGQQSSSSRSVSAPSELVRENADEKLTLKLVTKKTMEPPAPKRTLSALEKLELEEKERRKKARIEEKKAEERKREKEEEVKPIRKAQDNEDGWLSEDIVVKVVLKSLGEKYYGKKGYVTKVLDKYGALVKMIDTEVKLKLDQDHLETVIPNIGRQVKILKGPHKGSVAELVDINTNKFCVRLKVISGKSKGEILDRIPYENMSKLYTR